MSHTKGPWQIVMNNDCLAVVDANCLRITVDHREDYGDALPDARLIAAAPELLLACKAAFRFSQCSHDSDVDVELLLARAIAKAEGREP